MRIERKILFTFVALGLAILIIAGLQWLNHGTSAPIISLFCLGAVTTFAGLFMANLVHSAFGVDPETLTNLVNDIAAGKHNYEDKDYTGICKNIVDMAKATKVATDFSTNVLRDLPVPCCIFGADNRVKFTNIKMLQLLEHDGKAESYIGQTSGMFMFKDDSFMTATAKTLAEKAGRNLQTNYTTMKGNKLTVNGIATPIFNDKKEITDVISLWIDLTEQTKANERIADAYKNMQDVASELEQVSNSANHATHALSEQVQSSRDGASDQASRVSATATALEEMKATVLEVARSAGTTANGAATMRTEATSGSNSMQSCVHAMNDVRDESLKLKDEMGTLSGHAQNINEIMAVITDIADQTNLLALNAAIEAARAGEAGRGFAVVADEVRKLAEKTMTSTTDVGNAIRSIQSSTDDNTRLVEGAVSKIENVTEMVSGVGSALLNIVKLADETADQVRLIATAAEEQSSTSEEISRSIYEVNGIAENNVNVMNNANDAVSDLVHQTQILSELVQKLHHTD